MRYFVMVGAVCGLIALALSFFMNSAPQQAAMAGIACAFAVVPYVGWRVSQITDEENAREQFRADLLKRLEAMERRTG
jgi:hypothetical protein